MKNTLSSTHQSLFGRWSPHAWESRSSLDWENCGFGENVFSYALGNFFNHHIQKTHPHLLGWQSI